MRGLVTYTISYSAARALRTYGDEVELYWNAIGTEWEMPIAHAQVLVRFFPKVPREPFPLNWTEAGLTGEAVDLFPGEGITIGLRLPKDYVRLPGAWNGVLWFVSDNAYVGIPILVLVGMIALWWRRGRDPKLGTISPAFAPPKGLGPAAVGVLVDDRLDHRDLAAAIVNLAVKGHLRLREIWDDERASDFELVRTESQVPLSQFEEAVLEALLNTEYWLGWRLMAFQRATQAAATAVPRSAGSFRGGSAFGGRGFSGGGGGRAW